ncbi:hypothetical protein K431DRAFT_281850 [Polychaeton citri CBS 116435]|uniref:FAD-binding domain-containing protein n=1 Tax=Polychaeton citri CBS 116435 TaxID=1314669 RepID=A0A9P4QEK4_9PEZI|nr:hypothetical protein K431DRAFT_281850 [Polychaeton citri CBS 116435]
MAPQVTDWSANSNGAYYSSQPVATVEIPYLIIGAGPAGASLACFLSQHGLTGIIVSAQSGTSKEPRAHITNPAAQECLRDIGLVGDVLRHATAQESMAHTRWCHSMTGDEFARIGSWGNQPERQGDYMAASPCKHVDLPQTMLEPVLVKRAVDSGWKVRFDTLFEGFGREGEKVVSTLSDKISGTRFRVRSKYLFGCDGGRSQVVRQLGIPMIKKPGQGLAINVLAKADLGGYMKHRTGNLHWVFQPEKDHPVWGWSALFRMVKPWHEWMVIFFPQPGFTDFDVEPTKEEYMKRIKQLIDNDDIDVEILDVAKWFVNETVAERYSDGHNIHLLGDAAHRHPPFNGLGSNTCVQDAYNLAWKVAYVEKDLASASLLDTFSLERQPIGAGVITRANQGLRDHIHVWEALGALPEDIEERRKQFAELAASTEEGRARRLNLREAVKGTGREFGGIGIEMNQWYESSAVIHSSEKQARRPPPEDPVLEYQITTYPGARLPHAWLNRRSPDGPNISTIDLAGQGAFCLLTGVGGNAWKRAASDVGQILGVVINAHSIGWMQDWEDVYDDWSQRREVEEDGCVLCRPDRTVCWRSMRSSDKPKVILATVMGSVLGRIS